jgi:hypothetical protein
MNSDTNNSSIVLFEAMAEETPTPEPEYSEALFNRLFEPAPGCQVFVIRDGAVDVCGAPADAFAVGPRRLDERGATWLRLCPFHEKKQGKRQLVNLRKFMEEDPTA